jgi:hypothetical protein
MNQCRAEPGFSENGRLLLEAEEAGGRTKLSRSPLSAHKRLSNDDQAKKKNAMDRGSLKSWKFGVKRNELRLLP